VKAAELFSEAVDAENLVKGIAPSGKVGVAYARYADTVVRLIEEGNTAAEEHKKKALAAAKRCLKLRADTEVKSKCKSAAESLGSNA
jgi:hypothetical protein